MTAEDMLCGKLAAWADVAIVTVPRVGTGAIAVSKSDLLSRLIYGGEKGPSQTPCPVHLGRWTGIHFGWPGDKWTSLADGSQTPMEVEPRLAEWREAGCRCNTHRGSNATTGWNPDANCCAAPPGPVE